MEWEDKISTFKQIDVRGIQGNFFQDLKKQAMQLPAGSGLEIGSNFIRQTAAKTISANVSSLEPNSLTVPVLLAAAPSIISERPPAT